MKKSELALFLLVFIISSSFAFESWGFFAHKRINRMACFTLPEEMFGFYKSNIDFITEHAVDPDKRRYSVKGEAPRHYIDIDHFAQNGQNPFDSMPQSWFEAVERYGEDSLQSYGILPWHLNLMHFKLTEAFKQKDSKKILRISADIGHYVGDAHVPLHTTENYNGQLTGQHGIHGFWESRIPEIQANHYNYFVGKAEYIVDVQSFIWEIIESSHWAVDSVLTFEKELSKRFPQDKKYSYENRGGQVVKVYSRDFSLSYDKMLSGMIERRMQLAIKNLGNLWYTAWVNAGQPPINSLTSQHQNAKDQKLQEDLNHKFSIGRIFGREHDN